MNNAQKIEMVQSQMGISKTEAAKQVWFINWLTKWDAELELMFKNYQIETNDKELPFMGFCHSIYQTDKDMPGYYVQGIIDNN